MKDDLKDLPDFSLSVLRGLVRAISTDTDVFLLALAGILSGRRGLSNALLLYVVARRADQYAGLFASKLGQPRA